ncbi:uncharacterized protein [Aegilops tauschii subsp. strangulata]|uniref:Uncharacterized protein n=1 Tax=Aegilops tauschii TaxID=37682 RepID=M8C679_AEGTA|nr:uncharacterized protein LOC109784361 [Aegilops tauschii subsp. strangulata]
MALRSLSRGFPAGVLRQASPAAGFRLMGTRCQAKEAQEVLASLQSAMRETPVLASERHLLLHQQFTDLQEKTRRDLERMLKSANNMRKAADAILCVTILGVPLLLVMGSKDQA